MKKCTTKQLNTFTTKYTDWNQNKAGKKISATYKFDSHIDALTFVMRVSIHAQIKNHHPDIHFTYAKVKITLTTHNVTGLTQKDVALAKVIHGLYQQPVKK